MVGWIPEEYIQGKYFQNQLSEAFSKRMSVMPFGNVLDIGCGDGQFTHQWANQIKGNVLGIDNSMEMIRYANLHWPHDNLSFEVHNIEQFQSRSRFDFILSFWCLHWTNLNLSLPHMYHALKPKGRVYAILSSCSGNSISYIGHELAKEERYRTIVGHFVTASESSQNYFLQLISILNQLSFKQVKLKVESTRVLLPSMEYFKNLISALPFIKNCAAEVSHELIDDMVLMFQKRCERYHNGELYYETRPIYLEAIK